METTTTKRQGKRPDFDVCVKETNGEKNYYTKVGVAWVGETGNINVRLRQGISVSGSLSLFQPKEKSPEEQISREPVAQPPVVRSQWNNRRY
jgi:hypothetical protein